MNNHAIEKLGYKEIIESIKNMCISDIARDKVDEIRPSNDFDRIKALLKELDEALVLVNKSSSIPVSSLSSMENIMKKLDKFTVLNVEDFMEVVDFFRSIKKMMQFMKGKESLAPHVSSYVYSMYIFEEEIEEIERCIVNGRVNDKASSNLEKIRKKIYILEGRLKNKIEASTKKYSKYLQDNIVSRKNNKFVLAVKSEYRKNVPGILVDKSQTGSTVYIEPEVVSDVQSEMNLLKVEEEQEIYQIFVVLTSILAEKYNEINVSIETMVHIDVLFAKAKYAKAIDGKKVNININNYTKIVEGKHPLLGSTVVPLNFEIGDKYSSLVITGPNTGGKTVALKTIGLLTMMVQSGLFIPVQEGSEIGIYSEIFVDIGDDQSIEQNLSTFSSHIKNIIEIMRVANKHTLILLDELGSGTDPIEGEGLAIGILKYLHNKNATIVSTSHYGKIKEFAKTEQGMINGRMTFDDKTLKPLYKLIIGEAGESNAFNIALRLGMDTTVLEDAHKTTYNEEKKYVYEKTGLDEPGKYKKVRSQKIRKNVTSELDKDMKFDIGDLVLITSLGVKGIIYELENEQGEYGVMVKKKKVYVNQKRLSLEIKAKDLYPEDYDMSIVFDLKERRKKDHLMSRKYIKDLTIEE
jgi:dsDNA-specific endonuclease/ATPase MutS2